MCGALARHSTGPDSFDRSFSYAGSSMHGTFRPGDLLLVNPIAFEALRVGDVVVYYQQKKDVKDVPVVHRVQEKSDRGVWTRGDAVSTHSREFVTAADLIGLVSVVWRAGSARRVRNGFEGRIWGTALRLWRCLAPWVGWPYRALRRSGMVRRFWNPSIAQIDFATEIGPLVKYVSRGRTVAWWWPQQKCFWCRKPYDLIIERPH